MKLYVPTTPADRFAALMEGLRRAVAVRSAGKSPAERLLAPLYILLWSRLGRMAARFARLAARIPPDAPPRPHRAFAPRPRPAAPEAAAPGSAARGPESPPPRPSLRLPRRPGWLFRFVPPSLYPAASQLAHLLEDPAMQSLVAASPGIRRVLRPFCRMLGLPPPTPPARPTPPPAPEPPFRPAREPPPAAAPRAVRAGPRRPPKPGAPQHPAAPPFPA